MPQPRVVLFPFFTAPLYDGQSAIGTPALPQIDGLFVPFCPQTDPPPGQKWFVVNPLFFFFLSPFGNLSDLWGSSCTFHLGIGPRPDALLKLPWVNDTLSAIHCCANPPLSAPIDYRDLFSRLRVFRGTTPSFPSVPPPRKLFLWCAFPSYFPNPEWNKPKTGFGTRP